MVHDGRRSAWWVGFMGCALSPALLPAQTPTFQGVGQIPGGTSSRLLGVSADGTMLVGEAIDANGRTVAILYDRVAGAPTLLSLGFPNNTNLESHGNDVGVDTLGTVHVAGDGLNASNKRQAFHWSGTRTGVGTYTMIPYLPNSSSNPQAFGRSLVIDPTNTVLITGESTSSSATDSTPNEAYRYRSDTVSTLGIGFLNGGAKRSAGFGITWVAGETDIVGWSWSKWGGGNNQSESFRWESPSGGTMYGQQGLNFVCGGEGWQIVAGPNGIAESTATFDNLQIQPVGTAGLSPDAVVVSAGPDNILKDQVVPAGDDIMRPAGVSPNNSSQSRFNAISPDGRYMVGRSTYPGNVNNHWEAFMRDRRNRDYSAPDNCGGLAFHWPLGFLPGDNYSEARGVSNGTGAQSRDGLTVVGWSRQAKLTGVGYDNESRAFICRITSGPDIWFLKPENAAPGDNGAPAATRYQGMLDLKAWLVSKGVDMTGWELREATAVSDDGKVISGFGVHNGVTEGFIVTIEPPPPTGACCVKTGYGTGTCTEVTQADCANTPGGTYLGNATVCGADGGNCDFCGERWPDADDDGDVDHDDFAFFQLCYTGQGGGVPAGCSCFDRDLTDPPGIDAYDFAAFKNCVTGPKVAFDPQNPPPNCVP